MNGPVAITTIIEAADDYDLFIFRREGRPRHHDDDR